MRITGKQLRQIIREEVVRASNSGRLLESSYANTGNALEALQEIVSVIRDEIPEEAVYLGGENIRAEFRPAYPGEEPDLLFNLELGGLEGSVVVIVSMEIPPMEVSGIRAVPPNVLDGAVSLMKRGLEEACVRLGIPKRHGPITETDRQKMLKAHVTSPGYFGKSLGLDRPGISGLSKPRSVIPGEEHFCLVTGIPLATLS